jgi:hypothetical protein
MTVSTDALRDFFDRQIAALHAENLDGVMQNYRDDAVLIRFDAIARGAEELRAAMGEYLTLKPRTLQLNALQATDDVLFYEADMSVGGNEVKAYGTLVLKDGKIWRQTAVFVPPPGADAGAADGSGSS